MELWTEKYRPKTFDKVVGQKKIVEEVRAMVESRDIPHMLFYGPAGVGKTTMAYIVCRELFGENFKSNTLELNASDERGIQVIREKVKSFAKIQPLGADFKVIFLDEADYLTADAQASLRRIMEMYHKTTRFILCCNYINKIINPIQSRCKCYRFLSLVDSDIRILASGIAPTLNCDGIIKSSKGDLRKVINDLQGMSYGGEVSSEENEFGGMVHNLICGNFKEYREDIKKYSDMDCRRLLVELRDWIVEKKVGKPEWLLWIMKADERLLLGVDEGLVMDGLFFEIVDGGVK